MLTPKPQKFVDAYSLSGNATQAALAAGYSERTACKIGSENLQKPDIQAGLAKRQAEYATELEVTKRDVMGHVLEAIEIPAYYYVQWRLLGRNPLHVWHNTWPERRNGPNCGSR